MAAARAKKTATRKRAGGTSTAKGSAAKTVSRRRGSTKTTAARSRSVEHLVCPECGKEFTRAASLGAHRSRAHGVAGAAAAKRGSRQTSTRSRTTAMPNLSPAAGEKQSSGRLDRDALLRLLFPTGIPAREQVVRDVYAWLDQGEKLAQQR